MYAVAAEAEPLMLSQRLEHAPSVSAPSFFAQGGGGGGASAHMPQFSEYMPSQLLQYSSAPPGHPSLSSLSAPRGSAEMGYSSLGSMGFPPSSFPHPPPPPLSQNSSASAAPTSSASAFQGRMMQSLVSEGLRALEREMQSAAVAPSQGVSHNMHAHGAGPGAGAASAARGLPQGYSGQSSSLSSSISSFPSAFAMKGTSLASSLTEPGDEDDDGGVGATLEYAGVSSNPTAGGVGVGAVPQRSRVAEEEAEETGDDPPGGEGEAEREHERKGAMGLDSLRQREIHQRLGQAAVKRLDGPASMTNVSSSSAMAFLPSGTSHSGSLSAFGPTGNSLASSSSSSSSSATSAPSSSKAKAHACNFDNCGKSFDSRWALVRHVRTHTGEKPFVCTEPSCNKAFAEKSAMTRHLQTHSEAKPYKCHYDGCGKSFKGKEYLEFHLKIHAEGNPYACPHPSCSKTFCSPKSLKKHIRLWHNPGGKSTSVEQQLRERIIKMTNRHKEKQQKAEATIKSLTNQVKQLKREVFELNKLVGSHRLKRHKSGSLSTPESEAEPSMVSVGELDPEAAPSLVDFEDEPESAGYGTQEGPGSQYNLYDEDELREGEEKENERTGLGRSQPEAGWLNSSAGGDREAKQGAKKSFSASPTAKKKTEGHNKHVKKSQGNGSKPKEQKPRSIVI